MAFCVVTLCSVRIGNQRFRGPWPGLESHSVYPGMIVERLPLGTSDFWSFSVPTTTLSLPPSFTPFFFLPPFLLSSLFSFILPYSYHLYHYYNFSVLFIQFNPEYTAFFVLGTFSGQFPPTLPVGFFLQIFYTSFLSMSHLLSLWPCLGNFPPTLPFGSY